MLKNSKSPYSSRLRIEEYEEVPDIKYIDCSIDIAERYEDIVGITYHADRELQKILFCVEPNTCPYIDTKPLHRKEAGLSPKAENYTNWENTGLDGHIGGHYVSALSYMYASTGNEEIKRRLDYMISELDQERAERSASAGVTAKLTS